MKTLRLYFLLLLLAVMGTGRGFAAHLSAEEDSIYIREHFIKMEKRITMRDGKQLFTSIYLPKDRSRKYPILLKRTPYSVGPYGEDKYKKTLGPNRHFIREGYIFVYQDVRGRWMSEGDYVNVRPYNPLKKAGEIDESSDTWDTIDWLVKNIDGNNGRVGIYGISYPGFYSTAALLGSHPALKAVSPQAPVTDWFLGDDIFHNGAFFLSMFTFFSHFGVARPEPTTNVPSEQMETGSQDNYTLLLEAGTFEAFNEKYFHNQIAAWNEFAEHGTYDEFWQRRTLLPHLTGVKPAVMTVGGWFDAEDLYGPLKTYAAIRDRNPGADNRLVMGPWPHDRWEEPGGESFGQIHFGSNTADYFQTNIERPFFNYYLKDEGTLDLAEVTVFETGTNRWKSYDTWPPENVTDATLYLGADGNLSFTTSAVAASYDEYVSDPAKPVPYTSVISNRTIPEYMIEDQRFAATRPDVLVYKTGVLDEDLTLAGPLYPKLYITTTGTDADFVVKLIDVYPDTLQNYPDTPPHIPLGGYQQLVRADVMRAKFRNSFTYPSPIVPGQLTEVKFELQDVAHTFKRGHRIMVQVQSSWFPLVDRNPNRFLDIFRAKASDYRKATIRVYTGGTQQSQIAVKILPQ